MNEEKEDNNMMVLTRKNRRVLMSIMALVLMFCMLSQGSIVSRAATVTTVATNKYVTIKNVGSGKLLNVYGNRSANNTNITVYAADRTSGQDFQFIKCGSGYMLVPRCATNRAVNIYTAKNAYNNANICLWSKTNDSTQIWIPEYVQSSNAFILRSANNKNLVLTATGSNNSANVNVQTYKSGNKYQLWTSSALSGKVNNTSSNSNTSTSNNAKAPAMIWPLAGGAGSVSSNAGVFRSGYRHVGTDIKANAGTNIIAMATGTVTASGWDNARGYYVQINHGTYSAIYQHMKSNPVVKKGQSVSQGQVIGYVGNTGDSQGNHLHFEIWKNGTVKNSLYSDVNRYGLKPTYYAASRGAKSGNYYALNLTQVK